MAYFGKQCIKIGEYILKTNLDLWVFDTDAGYIQATAFTAMSLLVPYFIGAHFTRKYVYKNLPPRSIIMLPLKLIGAMTIWSIYKGYNVLVWLYSFMKLTACCKR
jgi:hypothetical protein